MGKVLRFTAFTVKTFTLDKFHPRQQQQKKILAAGQKCIRWDKSVYSVCDPDAGRPRPSPITTQRCILRSSGGEIEKCSLKY